MSLRKLLITSGHVAIVVSAIMVPSLSTTVVFRETSKAAKRGMTAPPAITLSGPLFGIELSHFQEDDEMGGKREKLKDIALTPDVHPAETRAGG